MVAEVPAPLSGDAAEFSPSKLAAGVPAPLSGDAGNSPLKVVVAAEVPTQLNGKAENSPLKHAVGAYQSWYKLQQVQKEDLPIDGQSLDIASVVAVAKFGCLPYIDKTEEVLRGINESVEMLQEYLDKGYNVYGVNTGFGGSADSRTKDVVSLQRALLQHTQSGVLVNCDKKDDDDSVDRDDHGMPSAWVKAMMLVRTNSIIRGHSAVTLSVCEAIITLLRNDLIPVVPARGSISASGDLMPLSFVAGAIQGNPDIHIRVGKHPTRKIVSAQHALEDIGATPIVLGPKEGLGLINGTAGAAAVASLAVYESQQLAVLAQILTGCAVESVAGTREDFAPFIAEVRPHSGQIEAAQTIYASLAGSRLVRGGHKFTSGLVQTRYCLRSASQWLSPVLEDLQLAEKQLAVELNSTTDNPLIDVAGGEVWHGANFQAAAVTGAVEKTRWALQMVGKMLFAQCTEIVNPSMNNGLPANLAADDPSLSFTMKGIDVNVAAYQAELAFLASPVSSHVQSAEMHNQAINSVALISARYTLEAVRLLSLISASHLYVCCQALDLRVLHLEFLQALQPEIVRITAPLLVDLSPPDFDVLQAKVWAHIPAAWFRTNSLDAHERCEAVASAAIAVLMDALGEADASAFLPSVKALLGWKASLVVTMEETYIKTRTDFFKHQHTAEYLGVGAKRLYEFVRNDLQVPFHQGLVEHPTPNDTTLDGRAKKTIGSWVGTIYEALRDGRLYGEVMKHIGKELCG